MKQTLERLVLNIGGISARRETLDGRPHLVVPAAILPLVGVLEGSQGPILYPEDENRRSVPSWNHRPLVIYHPEDSAGNNVSACSPQVLNTRKIGLTLNTFVDSKVRTECWIDEEKCRSVDKRVLADIAAGRKVEVSTGLFIDNEAEEGEFEGKKYVGRACNYRPDHLAVLPDKLGAYSVEAGGGIFATNVRSNETERVASCLIRTAGYSLKSVGGSFANNELSFDKKTRQLSELLCEKFGKPGQYWDGCVVETYDDRVVFATCGEGGRSELWMIGYSASGDSLSLKGEAKKVVKSVEYKPEGGGSAFGNSSGIKVHNSEGSMSFEKDKHLASMIGEGGFEETDRDWLSKLDDASLAKIKPTPKAVVGNTTPAVVPPITVPVVTAPVVPPVVTKTPTFDELLANADMLDREAFTEGRALIVNERKTLIEAILANDAGKGLDKAWLETQNTKTLRAMGGMAKVKSATYDFGAGAGEEETVTANEGKTVVSKPLPSPRLFGGKPSKTEAVK